ncbi:tail fiber protein [Synechococcus phage S-H38]|uniref:Tail fiber protein n=1 Tax=Synechococcus phage S-H38 TaxID=2783673 RepID=A0A873WGB8_9CAUD|nr:hydrolase [Synechococcus phage S-H38]QPB07972.1 tail fiber protein [Synechococcus phage S-H38]
MANRIQLRRGSAQEWANVNPTLAIGELGIEIDTGRIKIGDGVTSWNSLRYERPLESITNTPNTLVQRDADGNFFAGAITGSLIGNAATATRLANTRQIALTGDVTASATFDGSANLNLVSDLGIVSTLPHHDGSTTSSGQYTRVTVDAKGRIQNADTPNDIADYNLNGTTEGVSAQPYDRDLAGVAGLNTTGIITRVSDGNITTRTVTGTAGRISVVNGSGVLGNPTLDLINTTINAGTYNDPTIAGGTQTINATKFSVDTFGRFTYAEDFPIATAVEGSKYPAYGAGTAYSRYDIIETGGNVYQAIQDISAGGGAPTHTDASDTGGWRFLAAASSEQKGLASFAQEDFDVDGDGHVTIAALGVDNTQLQNTQIRFADGNSFTSYEIDNELTATTGYRGITTINDLSVNNTSGSPLLECLAANDNVDINTTTATIFSDITLDKTLTSIQTINRQGSLTLLMDANTASNRFLRFTANNAGAGEAKIEVLADDSISITSSNSTIGLTAEQDITISAVNAASRVNVEGFHFQDNVLSTTNATMVLDPADDDDTSGTVRIRGDLQVDGTTTTVNSTTITVQDPIITLGGEDTLTVDDNLDRGVEFRYYDTQERFGFFGWDEDYADANIWSGTGGYRFLYNATNTNEVFSGTDAALIAGNLRLTTNTGASSTTTGTLVVTGGVGISENLHVGGTYTLTGAADLNNTLTVAGQTEINNTTLVKADNQMFKIQTAAGVDKFTVDTDNGNTVIQGTLDVQLETEITDNLIVRADNKVFDIKTDAGVSKFTVDTDNGNTGIEGTLTLTGAADLNSTLNLADFFYHEDVDEPQISLNSGTGLYQIDNADYGAFRFDGGGYIEGDALFNSDVYVNGLIIQKEDQTANYSRQNYLEVRYKLRAGTRASYTPLYATDDTSNLRVYGGAGIATDLHIGDDLYIGKVNNGDNIEFQVLGENGNTTIGRSGAGSNTVGTLDVHGDVEFHRNFYAYGNVELGNSSGDTLIVDSTSTFNAPVTLAAGQNLTVGGNATVSGNLTVNGTTTTVNSTTITVDDPVLTLGGDTAPSSDDNKDRGVEFRYYSLGAKLGFFGWDDSSSGFRFLENATNNSEVFSGTDADLYAGSLTLSEAGTALTVDNNASIGGTLSLTGTATLSSTLGVTGATTLSSTLGVTGATTLSSTLAVTGQTTLTGLLDANGGATIDNVRIGVGSNNEIDTATGNLILDSAGGTVQVQDILNVTGIVELDNTTTRAIPPGNSLPSLGGAFQVAGGSHFGENVVINGDLKVYGAAVYQGGIDYQGTQTYSGILRQQNTTDASSATDQNASISTDGGVSITKSLWVGTTADITGTLTVDGAASFGSTITSTGLITANAGFTLAGSTGVGQNLIITDGSTTKLTLYSANGDIETAGNLSVDGNTTLGDAVGDTLTVNATATFNNADIVGTARDARRWTTNRTLSFTGDATGSMSVNGSANASAALTLANSGVVAGTYTSITVDAKGRATAGTNPTTLSGYGITDAQALDSDLTAIAGLTTTGIIARTAAGTATTRSVAVSGIGLSIADADGVAGNPTVTSNATPSNAASTLVARDASGDFTANEITADLVGNASTATALQTARTINGVSFDGTADITITPVYSNSTANGDAAETAFPALAGRSVNDMFVIVNGLVQTPTIEYTYTDEDVKTSTGGVAADTFITVASNVGLVEGMAVSGTGIGVGARIDTINGLQINLTVANTANTTGNQITFGAVVTLTTAPAAGTDNVSIRYLPLLN